MLPSGLTICHNRYRSSAPSGENLAVDRELDLLAGAGTRPATWFLESDGLAAGGMLGKLTTAWDLAGSPARRRRFAAEVRQRQATVLHAHNLWPLFTYDLPLAAREAGVPVVQTLHNYRLIATNGRLVQGGRLRPARDAAERDFLRRCGSNHQRLANLAYDRALGRLWRDGVPQEAVSAYICLTPFQRRLMLAAGLPAGKLVVKPSFLDHRGPVGTAPGDYAVCVGRLDHTKGVAGLLAAWPGTGLPLKMVGDGPLAPLLAGVRGVEGLGRQPLERVLQLMAGARFLVLNSTGYEGFPLVLVEALAAGTPCLVPDLGGMPGIIEDGRLGRVFAPDDAAGLVAAARRLWDEAPGLRAACRAEYEARYTPARVLAILAAVYANVIAGRPAAQGVPDQPA